MKDKPIEGDSVAEKVELLFSTRETEEIRARGFEAGMLIQVASDLAKFQVSTKEIEEEFRNLILQARVFLRQTFDKAIDDDTDKN